MRHFSEFKWAVIAKDYTIVAMFREEQLAHEAARAISEKFQGEYRAVKAVARVLVHIDNQEQFTFRGKDNEGNNVYCTVVGIPNRMMVACCNNLRLGECANRVVEAELGWDDAGPSEFVRPENVGMRHRTVKIFRIVEEAIGEQGLSDILQSAPYY